MKLSINKIIIILSALLLAAAALVLVSGALAAKKAEQIQLVKNESISAAADEAISACYSVYTRVGMPNEETAKLKTYRENMDREADPRIKAYIAYSMSEYASARIVSVKLSYVQDENDYIPAEITDGLAELTRTQNTLASMLEIEG